MPSARNKPPPIAFKIARRISLCFNALSKRYIASRERNSPRGSDLNHPRFPRRIIAGETAKKSDANSPAVVVDITLTRANITIAVRELKTTGNHITKS